MIPRIEQKLEIYKSHYLDLLKWIKYKGGTIRIAKVPPHEEEWTMWDENMSCCGGDCFITTGKSVSDCMGWLWANDWFKPIKNGTC